LRGDRVKTPAASLIGWERTPLFGGSVGRTENMRLNWVKKARTRGKNQNLRRSSASGRPMRHPALHRVPTEHKGEKGAGKKLGEREGKSEASCGKCQPVTAINQGGGEK